MSTTTYAMTTIQGYSRDSNSAGAPLPRIPRRTSSSGSRHTPTVQSIFTPPPLVVQPPTPPRPEGAGADAEGSGSGSGSDSPVHFVVPRARRKLPNLRPSGESTPAPGAALARTKSSSPERERVAWPAARSPTGDTTPRQGPRPTMLSVPIVAASMRSEPASRVVSIPRSVEGQLARGGGVRPLKSSLKSRREAVRGDLSVVTGAAAGTSKSEPTTPTGMKSVHFDTHLEHVKLFLAEQKPLAVSRDGSPREDTSGTESDFPAFIYGADEKKGKLVMKVVNMPAQVDMAADVALEGLVLAEDGAAALGKVRVRNVAFEKWVAIRFTLDWWQTTSEVTARYVETIDGTFDRFAFTIRLTDLLARIEEKTMFLAIRFSVHGREMWDNNSGENYRIKFEREKPAPAPTTVFKVPRSTSTSEDEQLSDATVSDLKSKLEKVAVGRDGTVGKYMVKTDKAPARRDTDSFDLRSGTPLSSRYDFAASLKKPWKDSVTPPSAHQRVSTHPSTRPWSSPAKPTFKFNFNDPTLLSRGSPRIFDDSAAGSPSFFAIRDIDDTLDNTPLPALMRRTRNHQRGYFDANAPHSLAMRMLQGSTPFDFHEPEPGSPPSNSRPDAALRYNSLDSFRMPRSSPLPVPPPRIGAPWDMERGGSEESTPSVTSTSESSRSSSPSGSPVDTAMFSFTGSDGRHSPTPHPSDANEYNVFLNKFCFYTGSDSMLDVAPETIQRSHSASSVEEFLSASPHLGYHLSPGQTPTRSSSFDDVVTMSGTTTPTARSKFETEAATPVPFAH